MHPRTLLSYALITVGALVFAAPIPSTELIRRDDLVETRGIDLNTKVGRVGGGVLKTRDEKRQLAALSDLLSGGVGAGGTAAADPLSGLLDGAGGAAGGADPTAALTGLLPKKG